jgi:hypothetical protein
MPAPLDVVGHARGFLRCTNAARRTQHKPSCSIF